MDVEDSVPDHPLETTSQSAGHGPESATAMPDSMVSTPAAKPLGMLLKERQALSGMQERMLSLRHASRCTVDGHQCTTPLCSQTKPLWRHLTSCKDKNCQTPHCVSSRLALDHYQRCQDLNCALCFPVRTVKSHGSTS